MQAVRKVWKLRPKVTARRIKGCFPIIDWLPKYRLPSLQGDIIAGFAVGLMIIPQSLAHIIIAGLPAQYGLYSSFPAMFIYMFLGTSKDVNIGTTVITALLTNRYASTSGINLAFAAAALTFFVGVVLVIVALCRLGFVVRFLSFPVISGFVTASSIIFISSQLCYLFGLSKSPRKIFLKLRHFFLNVKYTRPGDITMGLICLILLLLLQHCAKRKWKIGSKTSTGRIIAIKIVRVLGIARTAVIAVLAIIVSYIFSISNYGDTFKTVGVIPEGLPPVMMPVRNFESGNTTVTIGEIVGGFGSGLGVLPLIIVMQSVAASKALGRMNKYKIETFQEIIALGLCNIFGSFFGAIPMTASFSRSVISSNSGSKTPLAGVITSIVVILSIQFLSPVFRFAPMSSLAAIVIASVISLFDYQLPMKLWRLNKIDLVVWILTFVGCLYEIEIGIMAGVVVSLAVVSYREFNPRMTAIPDMEERKLTVTLRGGVWFPGIEPVADAVADKLERHLKAFDVVIIDCKHMYEIDYNVVHGFHEILADCTLNNVRLEFINVEDKKIRNMLEGDRLMKKEEESMNNDEELGQIEMQETGALVRNGKANNTNI